MNHPVAFASVGAVMVVATVATWMWLKRRRRVIDTHHRERDNRSERENVIRAQAIAGERERIYNDLHDDLGASLLQLIYAAPTPQFADAARAILQNLRDVVTRSRGTPGTLGDVLGDIRGEASQRLAAVGISLVWDAAEDLPDPVLETERALHLHRIVREAISNVIRHAQAQQLRIRIRASTDRLGIELTDDGDRGDHENRPAGTGIRSMRERAGELAAAIDWKTGTQGGTKVLLDLPLSATPA